MLRYAILCYAILRLCSCGLNWISMLHPHTYTAPYYYTAYGLPLWLRDASNGHYRWMQGMDWTALSTHKREMESSASNYYIYCYHHYSFLLFYLEVHVYITQSALALFTDALLLSQLSIAPLAAAKWSKLLQSLLLSLAEDFINIWIYQIEGMPILLFSVLQDITTDYKKISTPQYYIKKYFLLIIKREETEILIIWIHFMQLKWYFIYVDIIQSLVIRGQVKVKDRGKGKGCMSAPVKVEHAVNMYVLRWRVYYSVI